MAESADSSDAANRAEAQLAAHRAAGKAANRLLDEQSPYLLQHAYNPVDWYPWGDAAFDAAHAADKPVFVSIGYATCHWCHVMERESFENPEIAALMNEHFVNVKIDREERPDVDRIYMTVVQALTGSGGWPLSVFLTPERQPFYAGTYYPPRSAFGRPGFVELLTALARQWREKRAQLTDTAARITAAVAGAAKPAEGGPAEGKPAEGRPAEGKPAEGRPAEGDPVVGVEGAPAVEPPPALLPRVAAALAGAFDQEYAGFGAAPKFPRPVALTALLHHRQLAGDQPAQTMAVETLVQMARGGMYDQLGGGFHRYSVDRYWRVPHFEKMLYDQAQLVTAYVQAYQATGDRLLGDLAAETLEYVLRDLRAPEGGFYSAEDADSELMDGAASAGAHHRIEGAFYMWTAAELREHLGSEAERFAATYGVTEDGNTLSDPHEEFADRNVLYRATDSGTMEAAWRAKLWPVRARRPRPLLDDKIIAGWNGLTISALALAGAVLQRTDFVAAGAAAAQFVLTRLIEQPADRAASTRLLRRYRNGEARHPAGLADYAFVIGGLLDQYDATGDIALVTAAESLADTVLEQFVDADGALYDTPAGQPDLIVRTQELYDGAEPSGTASAIVALGRLGNFGAARDYAAAARTALAHALPVVAEQPSAAPLLALAADLANRPPAQVVLTGSWESAAPLRRELTTRLLPGVAALHLSTPEALELLGGRRPEVAAMIGDHPQVATEPQAFVCRDFVCELPVASAVELAAQLSALFE